MTKILEGIVGSTAYGLATENSDIDKLGIFVIPTAEFSRLNPPQEKDLSQVATEPDVTLHELGKFCRLALKANPTVLELLWLPDDLLTTMSEEGRQLRSRRSYFLSSKLVRDAYMGYATSQFKRLSERGTTFSSDTKNRTEKHARHLLRLMHQGYTLYTTGDLPIRLEDPERYHEFGKVTADSTRHAEQTIEQYQKMFDKAESFLPPEPGIQAVDIWLRSIRKKF
jgi:predicted nucleotidyltransferase